MKLYIPLSGFRNFGVELLPLRYLEEFVAVSGGQLPTPAAFCGEFSSVGLRVVSDARADRRQRLGSSFLLDVGAAG